jgi:uncharacterized protein with GYD domain
VGRRPGAGRDRENGTGFVIDETLRTLHAGCARRRGGGTTREVSMATYIMLINWTDQGIRHVKDSPDRLGAAQDLCRQHGAEMTQFYMTLGTYDMVAVVDAPNDETFAKIALSVGRGGNVRTTSLKAFDEAQYREIIAAIG